MNRRDLYACWTCIGSYLCSDEQQWWLRYWISWRNGQALGQRLQTDHTTGPYWLWCRVQRSVGYSHIHTCTCSQAQAHTVKSNGIIAMLSTFFDRKVLRLVKKIPREKIHRWSLICFIYYYTRKRQLLCYKDMVLDKNLRFFFWEKPRHRSIDQMQDYSYLAEAPSFLFSIEKLLTLHGLVSDTIEDAKIWVTVTAATLVKCFRLTGWHSLSQESTNASCIEIEANPSL